MKKVKIWELVIALEKLAPFSLQEDYDNAGLVVGNRGKDISGCLVCLDVTPAVLEEAIRESIPMIISHHPVIFRPLKRISEDEMTGSIVAGAIRHDIALCSMHTNLDNVPQGVNGILSQKVGLVDPRILRPMEGQLLKLVTFCPLSHVEQVRSAIFRAGAGVIGNYDCCSFNVEGKGTFQANEKAHPFVGAPHEMHIEPEVRIETILPEYLEKEVLQAMQEAHPYEEVAYDLYPLKNTHPVTGAGMIGSLPEPMEETDFMEYIKKVLHVQAVRHSQLTGKKISRVAICGGSGSFLLPDAIRNGADAFVTADLKYHQFLEAAGNLLLVDAGHFETEQFTVELIARYLNDIFPNFAVHISKMSQNPVNYL